MQSEYHCVRSRLIYDYETWPVMVHHEVKLHRNEIGVIIWICGFILKEGKQYTELKKLLGFEPVSFTIKRDILRWFGHGECKNDLNLVERCMPEEDW